MENDESLALTNATKPVWMMCKDLRHRCKWAQVEYDVSMQKKVFEEIIKFTYINNWIRWVG